MSIKNSTENLNRTWTLTSDIESNSTNQLNESDCKNITYDLKSPLKVSPSATKSISLFIIVSSDIYAQNLQNGNRIELYFLNIFIIILIIL